VLAAALLAGCAPAVVVVGAATYGAAVAHDRRSAQTILDDETIEIRAKTIFYQDREVSRRSRIRTVSFNYTVLLAGQADTAEVSQRFAEQVARIPKVERVYNEVVIGRRIGLAQQSRDAMIATRANIAIASVPIKDFDPTRVKFIVEDGTVFLMGLVTPEEGDATAEKVRRLPGVNRVVKIFDYIDATQGSGPEPPAGLESESTW